MGVFENKLLIKISLAKRDEVAGNLKRLHNELLNHLYTSPNVITGCQSRGMEWTCLVRRVGKGETYAEF